MVACSIMLFFSLKERAPSSRNAALDSGVRLRASKTDGLRKDKSRQPGGQDSHCRVYTRVTDFSKFSELSRPVNWFAHVAVDDMVRGLAAL